MNRARQFIVLIVIAGVLVPIVCYAVIWRLTETVRTDLRAIRGQLEKVDEQPGAQELAHRAGNRNDRSNAYLDGLSETKPDAGRAYDAPKTGGIERMIVAAVDL